VSARPLPKRSRSFALPIFSGGTVAMLAALPNARLLEVTFIAALVPILREFLASVHLPVDILRNFAPMHTRTPLMMQVK
jgi:hypothetical protein